MSVFFELVLNTVCRSNHHRLAVEALAQLQGADAERWRDLFLQQYEALLEGAKAPDTVFKDFKNHVLHTKDNYWGGAPEAAEEWRKRMVRALKDRDWKYGAYCAGVMSHYIVDPIQPFHTGQTEEEGVIHAAVEWSLSKTYPEMRKILLADLGGWPNVKLTDDADWLKKGIRDGADLSNKHYDLLIHHYNFEIGRKKPEQGVDQEIKDKVAGLIGHAVVLLARVFERCFAEAAVQPPKVNLSVQTLLVGLNVPVAMIAKSIENAQDRAEVTAMYQEFRKTGKVRQTLREDDKEVRALYAHEVLKAPLSTLDCKWPAETGLGHGMGAPARKPGKAPKPPKEKKPSAAQIAAERRALKQLAKDEAKAAKEKARADAVVAREQAKQDAISAKDKAKADVIAAKEQARSDAIDAKEKAKVSALKASALTKATQNEADNDADRKAAAETETRRPPEKAPGLEPADDVKRIRLRTEDSVVDAPSIGRKTADRLQAVSVRTVGDLLRLDPEDGARRIKAGHINAKVIRDWQAQARFVCSIPDMTSINAQLLTACGVTDMASLANADAPGLQAEIVKYSRTEEGNRVLRGSKAPEISAIAGWVNAARGAAKKQAA
jgi:hypothetical protein